LIGEKNIHQSICNSLDYNLISMVQHGNASNEGRRTIGRFCWRTISSMLFASLTRRCRYYIMS